MYNTQDNITAAVSEHGLAGLVEVVAERREAYRVHKTPLADWIVAGRFWLSGVGNVYLLDERQPGGLVIEGGSFTCLARGFVLPSPDAHCVRCGQAWSLIDAHDYATHDSGFGRADYHRGCWQHHVADRARREFAAIVRNAGLNVDLLSIPNRYGSEDYAGPWFTLMHPVAGRITLGWRKRVISLEWERGHDGETLFASETTTKDTRLVHAWTPADASRYLRSITTETA